MSEVFETPEERASRLKKEKRRQKYLDRCLMELFFPERRVARLARKRIDNRRYREKKKRERELAALMEADNADQPPSANDEGPSNSSSLQPGPSALVDPVVSPPASANLPPDPSDGPTAAGDSGAPSSQARPKPSDYHVPSHVAFAGASQSAVNPQSIGLLQKKGSDLVAASYSSPALNKNNTVSLLPVSLLPAHLKEKVVSPADITLTSITTDSNAYLTTTSCSTVSTTTYSSRLVMKPNASISVALSSPGDTPMVVSLATSSSRTSHPPLVTSSAQNMPSMLTSVSSSRANISSSASTSNLPSVPGNQIVMVPAGQTASSEGPPTMVRIPQQDAQAKVARVVPVGTQQSTFVLTNTKGGSQGTPIVFNNPLPKANPSAASKGSVPLFLQSQGTPQAHVRRVTQPTPEDIKTGCAHLTPFAAAAYNVGMDLVKESVYSRLLDVVDSRMKAGQGEYTSTQKDTLTAQVGTLQKKNTPLKFDLDKKCNVVFAATGDKCKFVTESSNALASHKNQVHVDPFGRLQCSFCPFWHRVVKHMLDHVYKEHNVKADYKKEPLYFKCSYCFVEDNVEARIKLHEQKCAKKFHLERNLFPAYGDTCASFERKLFHTVQRPGTIVGSQVGVRAPIQVQGRVQGPIQVQGRVQGPIQVQGRVQGPVQVQGRVQQGPIQVQGRVQGPTQVRISQPAGAPVLRGLAPNQKYLVSPGAMKAISAAGGSVRLNFTKTAPGQTATRHVASVVRPGGPTRIMGPASRTGVPAVVPVSMARMPAGGRPTGGNLAPVANPVPVSGTTMSAKVQTNLTYITCELCEGFLKNACSLKVHMKVVHSINLEGESPKPSFMCNTCGLRFYTPYGLEAHMRKRNKCKSTQSTKVTCFLCSETISIGLVDHVMHKHMNELKTMVKECRCLSISCVGTKFNSVAALQDHVYTVHRLKIQGLAKLVGMGEAVNPRGDKLIRFQPYCSWCKIKFASPEAFATHCAETHIIQCTHCGTKCSSQKQLAEHIKEHNEKYYASSSTTCMICASKVKTADMLYHYLITHKMDKCRVRLARLPVNLVKQLKMQGCDSPVSEGQVIFIGDEDDAGSADGDVVVIDDEGAKPGVKRKDQSDANSSEEPHKKRPKIVTDSEQEGVAPKKEGESDTQKQVEKAQDVEMDADTKPDEAALKTEMSDIKEHVKVQGEVKEITEPAAMDADTKDKDADAADAKDKDADVKDADAETKDADAETKDADADVKDKDVDAKLEGAALNTETELDTQEQVQDEVETEMDTEHEKTCVNTGGESVETQGVKMDESVTKQEEAVEGDLDMHEQVKMQVDVKEVTEPNVQNRVFGNGDGVDHEASGDNAQIKREENGTDVVATDDKVKRSVGADGDGNPVAMDKMVVELEVGADRNAQVNGESEVDR